MNKKNNVDKENDNLCFNHGLSSIQTLSGLRDTNLVLFVQLLLLKLIIIIIASR